MGQDLHKMNRIQLNKLAEKLGIKSAWHYTTEALRRRIEEKQGASR